MDSTKKKPPVEVAAAVLLRPDGSFLLAQRPAGKIWAGYWEFPGGKVEAGESAHHALVRELREELGIQVETAYPWLTRVFTYPHATVRLNFFRVTAWRGELHPHEGQAFAWQQALPAASAADVSSLVSVAPVLPANAPVLRALSLPALYAISNAAELGTRRNFCGGSKPRWRRVCGSCRCARRICRAMRLGDLLRRCWRRCAHMARGCCVNGDIELAREMGADGVHLNSGQLARAAFAPTWNGARRRATMRKSCAAPRRWVAILPC